MMHDENILEVRDLHKHFPIKGKGIFSKTVGHVKAVNGVSFELKAGESLGLVGESGCGKTTLGRCILRAINPTKGDVLYKSANEDEHLITELKYKELWSVRPEMQMIFQDPYSSLNPRMTIQQIVGEPLICNKLLKGKELKDRIVELVEMVGLDSRHLERYPHAFSGGQRQRIGIARALATNPRLLVCDEAVSALDVSVQAQILNLLLDLQKRLGFSYIFISHDLGVIRHVSDRVAVMYVGKIVELGNTEDVYHNPLHPYTQSLLAARPINDPRKKVKRIQLQGEVANPANPPSGCFFHPRCPNCVDACKKSPQKLREVRPNHFVLCDQLQHGEV